MTSSPNSPSAAPGSPGAVFLFSLPRSGSTLVQRCLATHPAVSTAAEPWLLLPLLYGLREHGAWAEYWHITGARALKDFCGRLPEGEASFRRRASEMAMALYRDAADEGARWFLDKTPRYHFIVDEIIDMFPDGRFIFLWRNPLAVAASMMETWGRGRWNLYRFRRDLFDGFDRLTAVAEKHRDRVHFVKFEDLLSGEAAWQGLCRYLDIDFDEKMLSLRDARRPEGRYGDPTGAERYGEVSAEPLSKWRRAYGNPLRKAWARRYVRRLGAKRLETMGYDAGALLREIDEIPFGLSRLGGDLVRMPLGAACPILRDPQWLQGRLNTSARWRKIEKRLKK